MPSRYPYQRSSDDEQRKGQEGVNEGNCKYNGVIRREGFWLSWYINVPVNFFPQMSKSTGNFLTLEDAMKKYSADAMRFALADSGGVN